MPWVMGCLELCVELHVTGYVRSLGYENELKSLRNDTTALSWPDFALLWTASSWGVSLLNKTSCFACYHPRVSVQFLVLGHKDTELLWNFLLTPVSTTTKLACPSNFPFLFLSETPHPLCAMHAQPVDRRSTRAINVDQHRIVSVVRRL